MLFTYNVFAFVAFLVVAVNGQLQSLIINVGLQGSFFSPETVSVAINTSVIFEFFGAVHSVTQSSFEDPCSPLPGGFHSGYLGLGPNNSAPLMAWNLEVTNVSAPIWYFCAVSRPVFHCSVGMVGVINPPSQSAFSLFNAAAKLVTTTASIGPTPILTGIGAFATSTPTISILPFTPSPTPTSSSTPTPTSTATPSPTTAPSSSPNLGAIVGGTVGGAIVVIALLVSLWFFCLRNKQQPPAVIPVQNGEDFFRYNPVPTRRPPTSEGYVDPMLMSSDNSGANLHHNPSILSGTNASSSPTTRLAPLRRPAGPVILEAPFIHRQMSSQHSDINSTSSGPTNTSGGGRGGGGGGGGLRNLNNSSEHQQQQQQPVDIRALAQEVAAVLYPAAHKNYVVQQQGQMSVQNHNDDADTVFDARSSTVTHQPPPNYRAATGPSSVPGSTVGSPGKAQYP